jgi:hypothetical protein
MKKLVTYWIIFSLISLFELTFAKPLEWFTIWPYMKLIVICWLVMPRFGHAYNAYTSIIQMHSNAKMQCFVDWLTKQDTAKTVDSEENFLSVVKKFVKENGSEALEELLSNKPKVTKTNVDAIEKMGPVEAKVAEKETRRAEFVERKETNKPPILPTPGNSSSSSDKVQKQWTCAVCQVTTSSEITLKSHLQGQRHILRCAELNAKKQARKEKHTVEAKKNTANKNVSGDYSVNQSNSKKPQQEKRQCKICNVSCSGDSNFKSHLIGKKHLEKLQELAASVTASQP